MATGAGNCEATFAAAAAVAAVAVAASSDAVGQRGKHLIGIAKVSAAFPLGRNNRQKTLLPARYAQRAPFAGASTVVMMLAHCTP